MYGPEQIFDTPTGLMLYVRAEERKGIAGHLLVGAQKQVVYTRWVVDGEQIPGTVINDTGGRLEATLAKLDLLKVEKERDALIAAIEAGAQSVVRSRIKKAFDKEMKK